MRELTSLVQRTSGDVHWHVLPDWQPILLGPEGLRMDAWRSGGQVRVVKEAIHRAVYRVDLPGREFYIKHYRCPRFWDVARHLVRVSSARREWQKLTEIARRGIATVRPLAWGERVRGGVVRDNYLVTEALRDSCTFQQYVADYVPELPPAVRADVRRWLLRGLARFAASIHRAGVLHNDFHDGNILVDLKSLRGRSERDACNPPLYLIDVAGVRLTGPLDWPASRGNLVVLNSAWWERATLAERWRFWRIYLACRPELDLPNPREAAALIERLGRQYSHRVGRKRDKRALRTNRDFTAVRCAAGEAHGLVDVGRNELIRCLEDPDGLLWRNLDRPVKLGHTSVIVEAEIPLADGPRHVALKRFRPRSLGKALKGLFRAGRARRGWWAGHALLQRRIPTPQPLALWEPRRPRLIPSGYLVTQWIEGAENLHLWGWRLAETPLPERLRRAAALAEILGGLIGRMHAYQIAHRDLKGSNVLVAERDGVLRAYLIDVDGIRIARRLGHRPQIADLARLAASLEAHPWVTRTVRCRFLLAYTAQFAPGEKAWKALWQEITRRAARLTRRKHRRQEQVL